MCPHTGRQAHPRRLSAGHEACAAVAAALHRHGRARTDTVHAAAALSSADAGLCLRVACVHAWTFVRPSQSRVAGLAEQLTPCQLCQLAPIPALPFNTHEHLRMYALLRA